MAHNALYNCPVSAQYHIIIMKKPSTQIILETIDRINASLSSNSNALVTTKGGDVDPESAYIELIRDLIELAK